MTPPRKQPTNRDLLTEITNVKNTLIQLDTRVDTLESWKIAVNAVDRYKADEGKTSDSWINKELIKVLAIAVGAIVSLIALVKAGK